MRTELHAELHDHSLVLPLTIRPASNDAATASRPRRWHTRRARLNRFGAGTGQRTACSPHAFGAKCVRKLILPFRASERNSIKVQQLDVKLNAEFNVKPNGELNRELNALDLP